MTKDERQFQIMLAGSMVLNFDDIGEMLMKSPAELRAICSQTSVQNRTLYTDKNISHRRRAGICGSTNNSNILRDGDENRYAVFSMEDIGVNGDVINSINANNIWRQAKHEAEQLGFESNFTDEETDKVIELAKDYLYTTPLEDFIQDNFSYCPECDMEWKQIKEECEHNGYGIRNNKELTQAVNKIIPVGKSAKKNKNGGFKRWCVTKGKKGTQRFSNAGDGLPF
jgi:predicted P-loop ATPase